MKQLHSPTQAALLLNLTFEVKKKYLFTMFSPAEELIVEFNVPFSDFSSNRLGQWVDSKTRDKLDE